MDCSLGGKFRLFILILVATVSLHGCAADRPQEWANTQVLNRPSVGLRIYARDKTQIIFEWRVKNTTSSSIWIPDESTGGSVFSLAPKVLVLPHDTFLFAVTYRRISDEQNRQELIETAFLPSVNFVEVVPGGQIERKFSIALPFELSIDAEVDSIFQYKGDYKHIFSGFSPETKEEQAVMRVAQQAILAVEYWDVDISKGFGLPAQQAAYDQIYRRSLVYQAVLAKKYPADGFGHNSLLVRHIVYTSAISCEVPLSEPTKIYYAPPVADSEAQHLEVKK